MARCLLGILLAVATSTLPLPSFAQRGAQVFDFFLQQLDNQIQREQQRQQQRQFQQFQFQRQQERDRRHQEFLGYWSACHDQNDIAACDRALAYPNLGPIDRQNLLSKRAQIVAAEHEAVASAERRRLEAELEEQLRRQREQAERAERELARQREEAERIRREREQEERRLAELRIFSSQRDACRDCHA